ncbi:MAG: DinB family protein [Thermomicrobiales bacterium]
MTGSAHDVETAIATANEAFDSAREYVESIEAEDMLQPDRVGVWSGKDLIIHIADWEAQAARILVDLANDRPETWLPEGVDGDTYNKQRVQEFAGTSIAEAMGYWTESHQQLIEAYRESGQDREDILFGLTRDHYRAHYPDFRHVKPFKGLSDDERAQLLANMDSAHQAFLQLIDSIDDDRLLEAETVGIWSGKDLIAHLGHWQQAAIDLTRELENDRPGKWPGEDGGNINEWNEALVEETRDQSLDEVRSEQQRRYDELRERISSSPFATRAAGIGATEFHYGLHIEDFEKLK